MLYECHGHIMLDGIAYKGAAERHEHGVDEAFVRNNLKTCADAGITYYRDGGDKHMASVYARRIAAEYGIDYRTPAFIIHKRGHYGQMFGRAFDTIREYIELVREAARLGADFVKITASGLLKFAAGGVVDGPFSTEAELRQMVDAAHGEGFAVMVHANGPESIKRAAEAGADSIEHGYYMDKAALRIMAQTGAVWVPTAATAAGLIGSGKYDDGMLERILEGHKAALLDAVEAGVPVACGSDAGAACVPQGAGTLLELRILEELGIDPVHGNESIRERFRRGGAREMC
ncbi:MAG: amidohydrolase family protein [Oscillospiraceae bacterium]|nr:amidohydrolase family protein [Oscillospiraceae bacterium]